MIGDLEKYDRIGEHKMDMLKAENDYAGGVTLCACGKPFGDSIGINGMCKDCYYADKVMLINPNMEKIAEAIAELDDPYEIGDDPWMNFVITVELFGVGLENLLRWKNEKNY